MNNYIKGEINIEEKDINKDIRIINSMEEEYYKKIIHLSQILTKLPIIVKYQLTMLKLVFHILKNLKNLGNMI